MYESRRNTVKYVKRQSLRIVGKKKNFTTQKKMEKWSSYNTRDIPEGTDGTPFRRKEYRRYYRDHMLIILCLVEDQIAQMYRQRILSDTCRVFVFELTIIEVYESQFVPGTVHYLRVTLNRFLSTIINPFKTKVSHS